MSFTPCVVAALIEEKGRYFICQRPLHKAQGGQFEFPGGKVEPGESHQAALVRECQEELGITIKVNNLFYSCPQNLSGQEFATHFYFAKLQAAKPALLEHIQGHFVYPLQMGAFSFSKADQVVAQKLQSLPTSPTPPFTHCMWDFDGTLFNSYPQIYAAMDRALISLGIKEEEGVLLSLLKQSVGQAIKTMNEKHSITQDLLALYRQQGKAFPIDYIKPYPGITQLLFSLHQAGVKHYVYTHRGASTIDYLKEQHIDYLFTDVITKNANFPRKPAPDALNWLIDKHHIPREKAIMIGDRPVDVYSGFNAAIEGALLDLDVFFTIDQVPTDIPLFFNTIDSFSGFLWGLPQGQGNNL